MADLGSTLTFDAGPGSPASGNYGNNVINNSIGTFSNAQTIMPGDVWTEYGPTILYPASAIDSLVKPSINLYKMRGYYSAGSIFEVWVTNDTTMPAPSGHILINVTVVDAWTV